MAQPAAGQLLPQDQVNYRTAQEGVQGCSNCANFRAPDQCILVQPPVGAAGMCDLWTPPKNDAQIASELFGPSAQPEAPL